MTVLVAHRPANRARWAPASAGAGGALGAAQRQRGGKEMARRGGAGDRAARVLAMAAALAALAVAPAPAAAAGSVQLDGAFYTLAWTADMTYVYFTMTLQQNAWCA